MRIAGLVFGLLGGFLGVLAGLLALGIGGLGAAFSAEGTGMILGGGLGAIVIAACGLVGAVLALSRPGTSAVLQILAALAGLIAVSLFWIPSALLFALGALAAVLSRRGHASHQPRD
ncbi:hypothetical protein [Thermomicrobium sp.]